MRHSALLNDSLPLVLQTLREAGRLDQDKLDTIREIQSKERVSLEEILIRKGFASEREIAAAYANHFLIPLFEPADDDHKVEKTVASLISEKLCRDHVIAPVAVRNGMLEVAFFTPDGLLIVDELQLLTGLEIHPVFARLSVVEGLLAELYDNASWPGVNPASGATDFEEVDEQEATDAAAEASEEVVHLDQPPPPGRDGRIIRFVNQILEQAFRAGASDIHIEPFEERCRIRLRIDGRLNEIAPPPLSMYVPIVSRIKVLAKMDIAERRIPQDGAIGLRSGEQRVDVRVNTVPTVHGEKVVLRVLDKNAALRDLTTLGLDERQSTDLNESIQAPHGLILVTGPTGSGKSTTLYACLHKLNNSDTNICTVEDPVEYKFAGINQVQTRAQVGFTFASALRSFLRQDPDVIMVGEVRDAETAQICLRAALTGHLVLSTLHTNDALAAIDRLIDMEIEPFLLASTLRVIVAQRLLRRLCQNCHVPYEVDSLTAQRVGLPTHGTLFRPSGCKECRETGYRGRVGVFEVVRITTKMAQLIQKRASLAQLRQAAAEQGMSLLSQNALQKVQNGITSLEEALRITLLE